MFMTQAFPISNYYNRVIVRLGQ